MSTIQQSIAELVASADGLTRQVLALLDEADQRIVQKIEAADFSVILANLINTGQVSLNMSAEDLATAIIQAANNVIQAGVAAGTIGTNAVTLGGHAANYFATALGLQQLEQQIAQILQNGGSLVNNTDFTALQERVTTVEGEVQQLATQVAQGGGGGGTVTGYTVGGLPLNTILDCGILNADGTPPLTQMAPQQDVLFDCGAL